MEQSIASRLAALFAKGEIDVLSYFKQCAALGLNFVVALGAVSGTQAWSAEPVAVRDRAASGYEGFVSPDLLNVAGSVAERQGTSTGTPNVPYSKAPPPPYSKFVKAPATLPTPG